MNKVCVVVGVGPGVGMGVARRFASAGYTLALVARNADKLAGYADEIGNGARGFAADAGEADSLRRAFAHIRDTLGAPEVLVYNTGVNVPGKPTTVDPEAFVTNFRVNVAGALVAAQAVVPAMREVGSGTILLTGGGLALAPYVDYASLAVGKAGIRSLAYTLHDELAPDGIHVATVTIAGFVQPGTFFDPDKIAETYWALHTQPPGSWDKEIVYREG